MSNKYTTKKFNLDEPSTPLEFAAYGLSLVALSCLLCAGAVITLSSALPPGL